jgi:PAS domain S-box-containing protein
MAMPASPARSRAAARQVDLRDLAAAFEHAPAGMAITSEGAIIVHANRALADLFGHSADSLVGRSVVELTHPDDLPASLAENRRMARGEVSQFTIEKRYRHATGRDVWARVHVSLLNSPGRRHHLLHVVDITHERTAAAELRESQERFREMTESVEQDFWLMSLEPMELVYSSPAALRIWGFDPMINRDDPQRIFQHIHPDDITTFLALFDGSAEGPKEAEYRILRPEGAVRWLRTRIFPIRDARGVPERLGGITEDVTSRKQAELEVAHHREFERVVSELSGEFVNLPAERLQQGFERAHGGLGMLFGAERATSSSWTISSGCSSPATRGGRKAARGPRSPSPSTRSRRTIRSAAPCSATGFSSTTTRARYRTRSPTSGRASSPTACGRSWRHRCSGGGA